MSWELRLLGHGRGLTYHEHTFLHWTYFATSILATGCISGGWNASLPPALPRSLCCSLLLSSDLSPLIGVFGSLASNPSSRLSPGLRRCLWEGACTSLKTWVSIPSMCLKVRCVWAHLWARCCKGRRQDKGWGLLAAKRAKENSPTPDSDRDPVSRD